MSFAAPDANPHKGTFDMASGGRLAPANPGHPYRGTVVTSKHRLEAEILQEMSAGATQFLERWLAVEGLSNYWLQILVGSEGAAQFLVVTLWLAVKGQHHFL
eukprot:scaffold48819_cov17-Tisochrysis_lutea.AAC.6